MIVQMQSGGVGLGELGISLKPPKKVRKAVSALAKKAMTALKVNVRVPTPAGPVDINPADPSLGKRVSEAVRDTVSRTSVTIGPREDARSSEGPSGVRDFVETRVPGGWLTLGVAGLAIAVLAVRGKRR